MGCTRPLGSYGTLLALVFIASRTNGSQSSDDSQSSDHIARSRFLSGTAYSIWKPSLSEAERDSRKRCIVDLTKRCEDTGGSPDPQSRWSVKLSCQQGPQGDYQCSSVCSLVCGSLRP